MSLSAGAVEVKAGGGVPFLAGVGEPGLELAVRLADDLAEGVVADVVDDRGGAGGGVELDQVADRAEVVAEAPGDRPGGAGGGDAELLFGQDLVGRRAVQVAVGEDIGRSREREDQVVAVVDEPLRRLESRSPVGIDLARDPAVEQVVGVLDPSLAGTGGRERGDAGQPVAVVSGEDLVLAGRPIRAPGPVAFGIVLIVVFVIRQQAVVGPSRRAGVGAIAVAVVLVVLVDLAGMRGGRDLARLVILQGAGAVDGGVTHRSPEWAVGPRVPVDLGPGATLNVLPFGEPAGGIVLDGSRGHDLGSRQIGCTGDAGPFSRQVGVAIDSLGSHQPSGCLLLLGDLRDFAAGGVAQESAETEMVNPSPWTLSLR
jgi:hypothetical protein